MPRKVPRGVPGANPAAGILPNGKTPGGPKGLPPGLGGAARGQGQSGGPDRLQVTAALRNRLKNSGAKRRGTGPRD